MTTLSDALLNQTLPAVISFLAKGLILVALLVLVVLFFSAIAQARAMRTKPRGRFELRSLNDELLENRRQLEGAFLSKKDWKERMKADEKRDKERLESGVNAKRLWVLDFDGDTNASAVDGLRQEVLALVDLKQSHAQSSDEPDEVVIRIQSPGGTVTGYGLAAAQLVRLREAGYKVTACVDEIAASGGYLMASVAHQIIAAPFALVGSIGVVASLPNFNKLLKKWDIEYLEVTAGEHKRPVSLFGEIQPSGLKKLQSQIEVTHTQFRQHVGLYRPQLALDEVANGDVWHAAEGLKLGLVDQLGTSDGYLHDAILRRNLDVVELNWRETKSLRARLEEETLKGVRLMSRGIRAAGEALSRAKPLSN